MARPADHTEDSVTSELDRFFSAASFGFVLVDRSMRCLRANSAFAGLLGDPLQTTEGGLLTDLIRGSGRAHGNGGDLATTVANAFRSGEPQEELELAVDRPTGVAWLAFDCFPVTTGDELGTSTAVAVLVRDVTARREGQEHLSRLAGRAHAAQYEAEDVARRQRALQDVTAAFAAATSPETVAEIVIRAVLGSVDADAGALYQVDETQSRLRAIASNYPLPWATPSFEVPLAADFPVCAAVRESTPYWMVDTEQLYERFPSVAALSPPHDEWGRHVALPLGIDGNPSGAIVFSWTEPGPFSNHEREFLTLIAAQCGLALARAELIQLERAARAHTERAADQALRLERLTGGLATASEPGDVVDRFLGDGLATLGAEDGIVLSLETAGRVLKPLGAHSIQSWTGHALRLDAAHPAAEAARSGQPVLLDDVQQIVAYAEVNTDSVSDDESWAMIPLIAYGETLGVIGLRYREFHRFDHDERAFLFRVGQRVAEALDRSRLYAHQRDAREQAEAAARWLRSVQSMAAALARSATRREVARALREHLQPATRADYSLVAAANPGSRTLDVLTGTATFSLATEQLSEKAARVMRDSLLRGRSIELNSRAEVERVFPELLEADIQSFALLPIRAGRSVVAVIGMGWTRPDALTSEGRRLLAIAVSLGGAAFERAAAHDLDHHIAETLQRHLLTEPNSVVPGVAWAARYAPGSELLTAGGDWYDVVALPDGRVAIVVGDIVGHGVVAAAAMGQLRSATRALAMRSDPVEVLEALDVYATATGQGNFSSVAYVLFDPATGIVEFAVAGHPPPLLRDRFGATEFFEDARGPLIGIPGPGVRRSVRRVIEPGTAIVLYSDGLVERRGASIDDGLARLEAVVADTPVEMHPEGICDRLLHRLGTDGRAADDITLLVLEFQQLRSDFDRRYPARLDVLRTIRAEVRLWLEANGIPDNVATDVVIVCSEACANAVTHGSNMPGRDVVGLELHAGDGEIVISVVDSGSWPPSERVARRGHGLDIMQRTAESVDIRSDETGTTVTLRVARPPR